MQLLSHLHLLHDLELGSHPKCLIFSLLLRPAVANAYHVAVLNSKCKVAEHLFISFHCNYTHAMQLALCVNLA